MIEIPFSSCADLMKASMLKLGTKRIFRKVRRYPDNTSRSILLGML
jgi:hypothetical protein